MLNEKEIFSLYICKSEALTPLNIISNNGARSVKFRIPNKLASNERMKYGKANCLMESAYLSMRKYVFKGYLSNFKIIGRSINVILVD